MNAQQIPAPARVVVAEDEPDIADLLGDSLRREGFRVAVTRDGHAALEELRREPADLVLLDLMLPDMSGLEVLKQMKRNETLARARVIVLTARRDEVDRILGFELGADDYVTKPFSPKELVARVAALLRRLRRTSPEESRLTYGPLEIDVARHTVSEGGREVHLTAKEFLLLKYLVEHEGRVLSRDLLLSDVWGYQYTGGTRTVDVHIRRLREKLPHLKGVVAYCYRHTFATEALVNGVGVAQVAELLGHTSTEMVSTHYGHLTEKVAHLREAARKAVGGAA